EEERYCLADLVAINRQDLIGNLYSEFVSSEDDRLGSSAENWCMMPRLGNHLYLAIDAGPIHDDDGNLIAVVETLRDMTEHKRAEMA
ncbi:PAS domain-containing protein, partial [Acinetobacter baumannii]